MAVNDEFGEAYGRTLTHDLVLPQMGNLTAVEAIAAGDDTRAVWIALCQATDVPTSRWYGVGQARKN